LFAGCFLFVLSVWSDCLLLEGVRTRLSAAFAASHARGDEPGTSCSPEDRNVTAGRADDFLEYICIPWAVSATVELLGN